MKRVLALLLLCTLFVVCGVVFTSCGGGEAHVHTYKDTWTKDVSGHWYDPTCECTDAPRVVLAHADNNNDGACDICTYTDHTHTYSEDYTADCTNHWNAADCGHTVAGTNVEPHADATQDGICDTCGYVIENLHNHIYSEEWTGDGEYHWHEALCEHKIEVSDKAAHSINDAGYCTICDAKIKDVDETDILAVLKAAIANNYKVVTGDVKHQQVVYNGSETGTLVLLDKATDEVYFVLGDGQSYVFIKDYDENDNLTGGEQQWFQRITDEEIFGVKMDVNAYVLDRIDGDPAKLSGYNYMPGDMLSAGYEDTTTLAQTLYNMYDLMMNGSNVSGVVTGYNAETGKYTFAYTHCAINEYTSGGEVYDRSIFLYEVEVEFSINDDFVIDLANFQVKEYAYTNAGQTENDLHYDEETGAVTKTDSANPTYYIYEVSQTSGERTFTSPYPKESLLPKGLNFYYVTEHDYPSSTEWVVYAETLIGDALTVQSGEYAYFRLGDPIPTTASFDFLSTEDFVFTFTNNNPDSNGRAWYMDPGSVDEMLNGYSQYIGCLKLKIRDVGTYTVTVGFGDVTKTFALTVEGEPVPEIVGTEDSISVLLTDLNTYENEAQSYTFTAAKEGNYTFTIPANLGVLIDGENEPRIDFNLVQNGGEFTLGLNAGDSVKFYFATNDNAKRVITIAFEEADIADPIPPEGGDEGGVTPADIVGTYIGTNSHQPDITVVIKDTTVTFGTTVCDYEIVDGAVVLYQAGTTDQWQSMFYAITLTDGKVTGATYNGYAYTLTKDEGNGGDSDYETTIVEGDNTLYFSQEEITAGAATRPLTITVAGTYQFNGDLFISSVVDSNNTPIEKVDNQFTLEPGSYTVTFGMFDLSGVSADTECSINLVNKSAEQEGGDEGGDEPSETLNATYYAYMEGQTILTVAFSDNGTVEFSYLHSMMPSSLIANYTIADGVVILTDVETGDALPQLAAYVTLTDGVPTKAGYNGWDYDLYAEGETPSVESVELSNGDNTVPVTGTNDNMTYVTLTTESAGVYYITVGTNAVVLEGYFTYVAGDVIEIFADGAGEIYTYEVNSEDYTECTVNLNVSFVAKAADEPEKDALEGVYKSGNYTVELYREYGTGLYLVTVTNADYSVYLQFTYTLTDNGDNSYTLSDLVNVPNQYGDAGTDKIDEIVANGITFSIDPEKEALTGNYVTIDGYDVGVIKQNGEYFLTISYGWDTTFYFTYTVTDNENGTLTLVQEYFESADEMGDKETHLSAMEALEIVINYDAEKEALNDCEYTGIDGYTVMFQKSEGQYYAYAFDDDYNVRLYFTYTITDGINGSREIALAYASRPDYEAGVDEELIATIEAHKISLGGLEGEGTYESPYIIGEAGSYEAPYQGGYEFPYFQFTVTENGYVTISSTYENFNLQYGTVADVPYNNEGPDGKLNEVKIYALAGSTVYFTVADSNFPEEAVNVPFTVAFEKFVSDDTSFLEGEWNGAAVNNVGAVPYTFIFSADGTGTGSYVQWGQTTEFTINYTLVDGNSVVINFTTSGYWPQEVDMTFTYDKENNKLTGDAELIKAKKLELGSVQINATNGKYVYYATEAIVLNLKVGASVMAGNVTVTYYVNGEEVKSLTFNENADVTLAIGDQLLVVITANTYSSLTVAKVYPAGSEQNPIAIETVPYDIKVNGNHDMYYTYTATNDIVLTVTAPVGCYVTNSKNVTGVDGVYTITLTSGETVTLNVWTSATDEIDYTYTITGEVVEAEGGETTGPDGVYLGSSGRNYQVTIDSAAGTITIIRSDISGFLTTGGATTYTANYSFDGTTVTYDGTYAMEFDSNGAPTKLTWGTQSVTNFVKQ